MSAWNYFVTAQPPTAVEQAIGPVCFTGRAAELVVVRGSQLEVFRLRQDGPGLAPVCTFPVNGKASVLHSVRPHGSEQDLLLLGTEKRQFVVLRYDAEAKRICAVASGSLEEPRGRTSEQPPISACDPLGRAVAIYMYESLLRVVDLSIIVSKPPPKLAACADLRNKIFTTTVFETQLDFVFLHRDAGDAVSQPRVAMLGDSSSVRTLSLGTLDMSSKELITDPVARAPGRRPDTLGRPSGRQLQVAATRLASMPSPFGGVLVLGGGMVQYYDSRGRPVSRAIGGPEEVTAVVRVDDAGDRWLFGSSRGDLCLLRFPEGSRQSPVVQYLGLVSPARCLACLGSRVFVGSAVADSQLLRLELPEMPEGARGSFVVEETWANLGPIVDFCVEDVVGRGQSEVVACSGYERSGALRFVRIGVAVDELGSVEGFGNVSGMWAFGNHSLVMSFPGRGSRILGLSPGSDDAVQSLELSEVELPGLSLSEETLFCCECHLSTSTDGGQAVLKAYAMQVTQSGVVAASLGKSIEPVACWEPVSAAGRPQVAAALDGQPNMPSRGVLVASRDCELRALQLQVEALSGKPQLREIWCCQLGGEASCLASFGSLCAAGLWTKELRVFRVTSEAAPSQQDSDCLCLEQLPEDTVPRSLVFARVAGALQLFVGLGDGRLLSFWVDEETGALSRRRTAWLGSQPVRLLALPPSPEGDQLCGPVALGQVPRAAGSLSPGPGRSTEQRVWAVSGRPTVIHAAAGRAGQLAFSPVCLPAVSHAAFFATGLASLGRCLAFVSEERLVFGTLEAEQRVHVRTVHLGESPQRMAFHRQSGIFAVACQPVPGVEKGGPSSSSSSAVQAPPSGQVRKASTVGHVRFVHGRTLQMVQTLPLQPNEQVSAAAAVRFEGDPVEYLALGIALVFEDEPEPSRGKVMLLKPSIAPSGESHSTLFSLASVLEVPGAVYALLPFQGMLLGSVNNRVCLWSLSLLPDAFAPSSDAEGSHLKEVCRHSGSIIALHVQAMGDHILLGDLMRSATLLKFDNGEVPAFKEVARDASPAWLTAAEMASESVFLCADDCSNLFVLAQGKEEGVKQESGSLASVAVQDDESKTKLCRVGQLHAGEFVNRLRRGSLVEHPVQTDVSDVIAASHALGPASRKFRVRSGQQPQQVVWASVSGAIGLIIPLRSEREFARLSLFQDAVAREVAVPGGLPHSNWRDHWTDTAGSSPHKGFIDGDLLERFLILPIKQQEAVVSRLAAAGAPVESGLEGLLQEIQELAQLH